MNKYIVYVSADAGKSSITVSLINEDTGYEYIVKVFTIPYAGLYDKVASEVDKYADGLATFLNCRYE